MKFEIPEEMQRADVFLSSKGEQVGIFSLLRFNFNRFTFLPFLRLSSSHGQVMTTRHFSCFVADL